MNPRYAILLDGGFVTKALHSRNKAFPGVAQIQAEVARIKARPELAGHDLLRIYFYDAPPATGSMINPIDGSVLNLGNSAVHSRGVALLDKLELEPDFAVRRGEMALRGWKIGPAALDNMLKAPRAPVARDLVPNVERKGVDLRIGLDIARLSLRQFAQILVVVTGDSDLIPAFKFARREGMRIFLDALGANYIKRELKVHADHCL